MASISNLKTVHEISFFDFMRCFFCDPKRYNQLTKKAKDKHIYMFYRTMSIMYPVQMHAINFVHDIRMVDQLQKRFGKQNGPYPKWLYTKSEKEKTAVEKLDFQPFVIEKFCTMHDLEPKSFEFLLSIDRPTVVAELTEIADELQNDITRQKQRKKKKSE